MPGHADVLTEVAWSAFAAQRFSAAQTHASRALAVDPTNEDALNVLVQTHVRTGHTKQARRAIASVRAQHDAAFVACLEVTVFAEEDRIDQAGRALDTCRKSGNDTLVGVAEHRLATLTGDHERFLSKRSMKLAERTPTGEVKKAIQLYTEGKHDKAERALMRYLSRFPDDLYARGVLGVVFLRFAGQARGHGVGDIGETF